MRLIRAVPKAGVSRVNQTAVFFLASTVLVLAPGPDGRASPPAPAVAESNPPARTSALEAKDADLLLLWRIRRDGEQVGDQEQVKAVEAALQERRKRDGIGRAEDLASAFVLEGYEQLALGHYSEAQDAFLLAVEFDPDMPRAYRGLARVQWAVGDGAGRAVASLAGAVRAAGRNWLYRTVGWIVAGWAVLVGLPVAAGILLTLLFLRVSPLVQHRLREALGRRLPTQTASILATGFPWVPLALPWGMAWAPLVWITLAGPFLSRRETRVAATALVVLAVCGLSFLPAAQWTAASADPRLVQVASAAGGAVGPGHLWTIQKLVKQRPDDPVLQVLLGDQLRGAGDYSEALRAYHRARNLNPGLRQARNNAGALYFSLGQYATAIQEFHAAIEAEPADMTAHYNLYLTQEHRFDFAAAEQTLATAQSIDLPRMTALLSEHDQRQGRLDVLLDAIPLSTALVHGRQAAGLARSGGLGWLGGAYPFILFPALALVLLLRRTKARLPVQCHSCGRIACPECALILDEKNVCGSCLALAARNSSLPRKVRDQKRAAVASYLGRWHRTSRLLSVLLPGAGQVWAGRPATGFLVLSLVACAGTALLLRPQLPEISYTPISSGPTLAAALSLLLLGLGWICGVLLPSLPVTDLPERKA